MVSGLFSAMQVPIPLVPSNFSLQTAPVQSPHASKVLSSAPAPRRSSTTPALSASNTEHPTPPRARNSRSRPFCATFDKRPRRSRPAAISDWGRRYEGTRFVGSSACKCPERRHEAATSEQAPPPASTSSTISAWAALGERPMLPSQSEVLSMQQASAVLHNLKYSRSRAFQGIKSGAVPRPFTPARMRFHRYRDPGKTKVWLRRASPAARCFLPSDQYSHRTHGRLAAPGEYNGYRLRPGPPDVS